MRQKSKCRGDRQERNGQVGTHPNEIKHTSDNNYLENIFSIHINENQTLYKKISRILLRQKPISLNMVNFF